MPNFSLVNKESMDNILKAEIFIHSNGQLRAAHLILGYTPISKTFLAPKCVIKVNNSHLQRISVAALGFLLPGPKPEDMQVTTPIFEDIPKVEASSTQQITKTATLSCLSNIKEGKVVEVADSEDKFEVFNQAQSSKTSIPKPGPPFSPLIDEMGI